MDWVQKQILAVPDFPSPGIVFRDITPVLADAEAFHAVIDAFAERYRGAKIDKVVGIESRGFILGAPLAYALGAGFILMRKPGKLPRATKSAAYALEYGESTLHVHHDALLANEKVVIVDDVIATGGTLKAALGLCHTSGAKVHEIALMIELAALKGRAQLKDVALFSLFTF